MLDSIMDGLSMLVAEVMVMLFILVMIVVVTVL